MRERERRRRNLKRRELISPINIVIVSIEQSKFIWKVEIERKKILSLMELWDINVTRFMGNMTWARRLLSRGAAGPAHRSV